MRIIYETVYELLKDISYFRDGIFLKNSILLDQDKKVSLNLSWFPDNSKLNKDIIDLIKNNEKEIIKDKEVIDNE